MRLISLICLALCLIAARVRADEAPNLIPNGDFSQGVTGWKLEGADRTQSSVVPVVGQPFKRALRVKVEPKPGDQTYTVQLVAPPAPKLQTGQDYWIHVWVRSMDPDVTVSMECKDEQGKQYFKNWQTLSNEWRFFWVDLPYELEKSSIPYKIWLNLSYKAATIEVADFRLSEFTLPTINTKLNLNLNDKVIKPDLNLQVGHSDAIGSIDVFPDGKRIVSASWDGAIKIWDIPTQRIVRTIQDTDFTWRIRVSPDGQMIAAAAQDQGDNGIRIYQGKNGVLLKNLSSHGGRYNDVVFTDDSTHLISAGHDEKIEVWNLLTNTSERVLSGHTGIIHSLALSRDGRILASASEDKSVKLWIGPMAN